MISIQYWKWRYETIYMGRGFTTRVYVPLNPVLFTIYFAKSLRGDIIKSNQVKGDDKSPI